MLGKLITLVVVLGCCSAYWGAYRISLNPDQNTAHILSHNGRRIDLRKSPFGKLTGPNGWEITLSGPHDFPTTIQSNAEVEYQILLDILAQNRGVLDDGSFQHVIHTLQHYSQRGVLDERVLGFFRKLGFIHNTDLKSNNLIERNDCSSCCEMKCQNALLWGWGIRSHQSCIENCISDVTNECDCFKPILMGNLNPLNFESHLEEAHHHHHHTHPHHHNQQDEDRCISCCNERCHHKNIFGTLRGNLEDCLEQCLTNKNNDECDCSRHHEIETSRYHHHKSSCLDCCEKKCGTLKIFGVRNHQDCLGNCLTGASSDCRCENRPRCVNCCLSRCQKGDVFWGREVDCLSKCLNDEDSLCYCGNHHLYWREHEQHPLEWRDKKFQIFEGAEEVSKRCEHCCEEYCHNAWKEGLNKHVCVNLCKANALGAGAGGCSCGRNFW